MKPILALAIALVTSFWSCSKERNEEADCQQLQNGISSDNRDEVKDAINKMILSLPSQKYSSANLDKLVILINQQCGPSATRLCFDCIETLPSQSEIRVSYPSVNGPVEKVIDISYTAGNKMTFSSMHN